MKDLIMHKQKIINLILTIIGVVGVTFCAVTSLYDYILEQKAIKVNSTIKELSYSTISTTAKVEYEINRKSHQTEITFLGNHSYAVNDKITIKIDIYNPEKTINNEHYYITIPVAVISILFCIITLPKSLKYMKSYKNRKNLIQNGIFINAPITEVFVNNNGKKIKGMFPYRIRCKYQNPLDQNLYVFDSEDTFSNLEKIIRENNNKTIVVYIEKNHPENYYVDLNSLVPQPKIIDPIEFMKSSPKKEETPSVEDNSEVEKDESTEESSENKE